ALADLGEELCFAKHPLRWLGPEILQADRPIETLSRHLDKSEDLIDTVENALELSGLPAELWDTFEEIRAILEFATRAAPLAQRNLLETLVATGQSTAFDTLSAQLDAKVQKLAQTKQKTTAWKEPLAPDDTQNALAQAQTFENSIFRFLQPAF